MARCDFELIGFDPYTRTNGTRTDLAVWRGHCRVCGAAFTVKTPWHVAGLPVAEADRATQSFAVLHCKEHRLSRREVIERLQAGRRRAREARRGE